MRASLSLSLSFVHLLNEMEAEERGHLIPGLPEELVLAHVLPRLPWYTRPLCRAISKVWQARVDTSRKRTELQLKTREHQLPLLRGLFLISTFDSQIFITRDCVSHEMPWAAYAVQWRSDTYQIHRQWRKLPPLQELFPPPPTQATIVASSGMVFVWSDEEPNFVLKMDMGCGDWTWNKFSVPRHFNVNAVDFNGKIYVPRALTGVAESPKEEVVLVYDMMTDQCEQVRTWNRDNLRVLLKKSSHSSLHGEEELYSFVEDESSPDAKLELHVYDACRDSWRTQEEIPFPEYRWSELPQLKLLNGDCFEPAPEMGTNTLWIDYENQFISWFNSSLHNKNWIDIDYNPFLEGRCLEYIQFIRGSLYGTFIEDKDDEEEDRQSQEEAGDVGGRQDPTLYKRTIMKGRICVASSIVSWEEVHEVGCFDQTYYINPSVVLPIHHYTVMA